jgi:type II secretory pathway pseudopilin PulG
MFSRLRDESGNWTLIGLLVAVAIGTVLVVFVLLPMMSPGSRAEKEGLIKPKAGQTVVGASMDKGKETECMSNLRQIRMSIDASRAAGEQLPASLQDLKLGSAGTCPMNGQPYQYDPSTGQVRCATPGHENL